MGNFEKILNDEMLDDEISSQIEESYNSMYECFLVGNPINLARKIANPGKIKEMIDHFSSREEYEKCGFLSKILEKI
jgi:hypothetical protein